MHQSSFYFLKSVCKARTSLCAIAATLLLCSTAHAEYLGLISGREASPANTSDLSVELGFVTGDLGDLDYQNIAARVNYRLSPELVLIGTVGTSEFGDTDGVPLGLGAMYFLSNQRISKKVNIAGKASYHFGDYSLREIDGDLNTISLDALVSGANPLMENGLAWYTSFGYQRINVDFGSSDTAHELALGAGLVLPTGLGEAYLGAALVDEVTIGVGIRYFVKSGG